MNRSLSQRSGMGWDSQHEKKGNFVTQPVGPCGCLHVVDAERITLSCDYIDLRLYKRAVPINRGFYTSLPP
jgi:hypothetical protein